MGAVTDNDLRQGQHDVHPDADPSDGAADNRPFVVVGDFLTKIGVVVVHEESYTGSSDFSRADRRIGNSSDEPTR